MTVKRKYLRTYPFSSGTGIPLPADYLIAAAWKDEENDYFVTILSSDDKAEKEVVYFSTILCPGSEATSQTIHSNWEAYFPISTPHGTRTPEILLIDCGWERRQNEKDAKFNVSYAESKT